MSAMKSLTKMSARISHIAFPLLTVVSGSKPPLPSWLSHVDDAVLQRNLDLARSRHKAAIQAALTNFDTGNTDTLLHGSTSEEVRQDSLVSSLEFDEFKIVAPGYHLPDFHDELGNKPVFVTRRDTPMFTKDECSKIVQLAEEYYSSIDENGVTREWPTLPSGQYYIQGFWIKDGPPEIKQWFVCMVKTRLFEVLRKKFPDFVGDSIENLVVDNAYMFKYTARPGLRTEIHTDAGCLSFTFALNSNSEYVGGGTYVEGLTKVAASEDSDCVNSNNVIEMDVGQCTVRPGGIRHGGNPLESGTRYIIGGFCMHKDKVEIVRMLLEPNADAVAEREALESAIAFNVKCDLPYSRLAHIYEKENDLGKAVCVVEDCLTIANPVSASAAYYLGTMSYRSGDYKKCIRMMDICLEVDPKDGDAMQSLYQSYAKLGMANEELKTLRRIVATPGVSNRVIANAHCNIGVLCNNIDDEIRHYLNAIECNPSHISSWHSFGSALASQKKWEQSVRAYRKAIELINTAMMCDNTEDSTLVEQKKETLSCLYRAASRQIRGEVARDPPTREVMLDRLKQIMGKKSFAEIQQMRK